MMETVKIELTQNELKLISSALWFYVGEGVARDEGEVYSLINKVDIQIIPDPPKPAPVKTQLEEMLEQCYSALKEGK